MKNKTNLFIWHIYTFSASYTCVSQHKNRFDVLHYNIRELWLKSYAAIALRSLKNCKRKNGKPDFRILTDPVTFPNISQILILENNFNVVWVDLDVKTPTAGVTRTFNYFCFVIYFESVGRGRTLWKLGECLWIFVIKYL